MAKTAISVPQVLDKLESFHGHQEACWPVDPYLFLVWWHCGYPASDAACDKGWEALNREVGTSQQQLLATPVPKLAQALTRRHGSGTQGHAAERDCIANPG